MKILKKAFLDRQKEELEARRKKLKTKYRERVYVREIATRHRFRERLPLPSMTTSAFNRNPIIRVIIASIIRLVAKDYDFVIPDIKRPRRGWRN